MLRDERDAVLRLEGERLAVDLLEDGEPITGGRSGLDSSTRVLAKLSVSNLETQLNSSRKFCASQLLDSTRVGKICYSGELESPEIA